MDKWTKDHGAIKDYGLILLLVCLWTGWVAPILIVKWGLIAWIVSNLWKRYNG